MPTRGRRYTRRTKRAPRKKVSRSKKYGRKYNNRAVTTVMQYPFPPKMRTRLTINVVNGLLSALTAVNSIVYRPTSYFDIDPALGGPSYGGYTQYAAMYNRYRVLAFKYTIRWTNLESDTVIVSAQALTDASGGGAPPSGTAADYTEPAIENNAQLSRWTTLGPVAASPQRVLKGFVKAKTVWATPEVYTGTEWASNTGTSPVANTWLRLAARRANNAAMTTGVQFIMKITAYGYWDQNILTTA